MQKARKRSIANMEENKIARMRELTAALLQAARAYYQESREVMSNIEYD